MVSATFDFSSVTRFFHVPPPGRSTSGLQGAVGVDHVAAVHEEVRIEAAHHLVEAHAAPLGVDAPALPGRVARPHEGRRRVRPPGRCGSVLPRARWSSSCRRGPGTSPGRRRPDRPGSPARTTRAVYPLSGSAAGPTTRRGFWKRSVAAYSTSMRAGRSVTLHTIARSAVTSPVWTPKGTPGRGDVCAATRCGQAPAPSMALPAARVPPRKRRRERELGRVMSCPPAPLGRSDPSIIARGCRAAARPDWPSRSRASRGCSIGISSSRPRGEAFATARPARRDVR